MLSTLRNKAYKGVINKKGFNDPMVTPLVRTPTVFVNKTTE